MAASISNGNSVHEEQEPALKVARLSPQPLLKVKKLSANAVLPKRSSALAAGYDLSSAVETVVPARGKALVPTDLSVAFHNNGGSASCLLILLKNRWPEMNAARMLSELQSAEN
ncbi:hypothetical protein EJB05_00103 [Eragrostis curvula]|uniref:dUTP diphosphatase n=1 Tax=Eragrostis curvula TaxID=38414 RepID=A0A5J9WLI7_9POAL|nr:hypothetical protein EJB05_00103 [Eragrostis curvula]